MKELKMFSDKSKILSLIFVIFFSLTMSVICLNRTAKADAQKYTVVLKSENIPEKMKESLTAVNQKHRIYATNDHEIMQNFSEYIEYCEPNDEISLIDSISQPTLASLPLDKYYPEQWQMQKVNADYSWEKETYGNDINVAVIDTGCNYHEDIKPAGGYNFVLNNNDFSDSNGHGTHVSGIIGANHNNIGIAGVAPKVNIYALKCVQPGYSSGSAELAAAILAAVDDYDCKVINMSLGITSDKTVLREAVKYAHSKGVVIVAAVGNDGTKENKSQTWYPAGYSEVIGVGSVGATNRRSSFSQQNNTVTVCAPGESCVSTTGKYGYSVKSGTSQATPIVTASVAILMSAKAGLDPDKFTELIVNCSTPLVDDYCGYGLLNIEAMFEEYIKDEKCYVSPVNNGCVLICNNSDSALYANAITALYDDNKFLNVTQKNIILLPEKKMMLNTESSEGATETKFFLWDSIDGAKPLCKVRAYTQ